MSDRLKFDQLDVGQTWTSDSRTVTESDVVNFANITGDFNPLHVSHEYARSTHYRQPIAHGLLGMAWAAGLGSQSPRVDTVAFLAVKNWEFVKPIFFGDTVYLVSEVTAKQSNGRRTGRVTWQHKLFNQNDELTQQGTFETLVRIAKAVGRPHIKSERANQFPANAKNEM